MMSLEQWKSEKNSAGGESALVHNCVRCIHGFINMSQIPLLSADAKIIFKICVCTYSRAAKLTKNKDTLSIPLH